MTLASPFLGHMNARHFHSSRNVWTCVYSILSDLVAHKGCIYTCYSLLVLTMSSYTLSGIIKYNVIPLVQHEQIEIDLLENVYTLKSDVAVLLKYNTQCTMCT